MKKLLINALGLKNVLRLKTLQENIFPTVQQKEQLQIRKNFYAQFIKNGDLCFDVGANLCIFRCR